MSAEGQKETSDIPHAMSVVPLTADILLLLSKKIFTGEYEISDVV
jgi:hypothetical protein